MIGYRMNGHVIVAVMPAKMNEHFVILAFSTTDTYEPFVTALIHYTQMPHPQEWWTGHYHHRLQSAVEDFMDRATVDPRDVAGQLVMAWDQIKGNATLEAERPKDTDRWSWTTKEGSA